MKQAVTAVIRQDNKILLHQRSMNSRGQPGKWENAGGEIDKGETPELAIVREIKEELGVDFTIEKRIYEDNFDSGDDAWHVIIFGGTIIGTPRVMNPEETSEVKWFSISQLKKVDLASYTRQDFEKFGWIKPH
ncbi:MAG: CTP pyrophosphohydrolase [Candidatus Woesebacteria bacterium GW2011_GWA2_40_7b]|uniref:CTP pyrophosphohydrolase n=1 Tax=Candidatus Woesebacteria bacterium GW2011_GWA2_40_7b TaxID=1618563 RepID=A0A0G0SYW0_9BACT|nr:MAG: CTP pyrophosphohydrolase [Candidatus Woesebacteria bacterium GW2011_GWA2_40_7b]